MWHTLFKQRIGGKFAPLISLSDEDMGINTIIITYNTVVTVAASDILGKERQSKKPWVTGEVLDLCDARKKRSEEEAVCTKGANEHRETNMRIQKAVKNAKGDRIGTQYEETDTCLNKSIPTGEGTYLRETG